MIRLTRVDLVRFDSFFSFPSREIIENCFQLPKHSKTLQNKKKIQYLSHTVIQPRAGSSKSTQNQNRRTKANAA
jgi:hypothetical protein